MATLVLTGGLVEWPDGNVSSAIDQRMALARAASRRVLELDGDDPVAVSLDGMDGVNALELKATATVQLIVTWANGIQQTIPADYLVLFSRATAITAVSLARVSGQSATVTLILGQK